MPSVSFRSFLQAFFISVFIFSCADPVPVKETAKKKLEEKYGIPFDILSYTEMVLEKPRYEMSACPHSNPDHVFHLVMNKKFEFVEDDYIYSNWLYQASDELKSFLKPSIKKLAVLVEPNLAYLDNVDDKNIPSFDEALKHQQEGDDLDVTVYFFRDYSDSTKKELFDDIRKIIEYFNDKKVQKVNYEFTFYDEQFFKNIDTDHQYYIFQGRFFHYPKSFESTYLKKGRYGLNYDCVYSDPLPKDSDLEKKMVDWSTFGIK